MFNTTEDSLMKFKVPLFGELYDHFVKLDNLFNSKFINYNSIIKKNGDYPPYIKIKFNANTKFSLLDTDGQLETHEFKNVKTLKSVFKFNFKTRFIFSMKKWSYANKHGINVYAIHVQADKLDNKFVRNCDFI